MFWKNNYERLRRFVVGHQPAWFQLLRFKMCGYYTFSFKYFTTKWDKIQLKRYINIQLPTYHYRLNLIKHCVDEYKCLRQILKDELSKEGNSSKRIMDWGCGLGRSSVFFMQMFGLQSSKFILVDGHSKMYGTKENLTDSQRLFHQDVVPIFEKNETFYTDFDLIDRFVTSNGMQFFNLINLNKTENQLTQIPEKVEIFYSFHSIGYHWDILPTLDYYKIHDILKKNALLIFGIRRNRSALSKELRIDDLPKKGYEIINKIEGDYHQGFLVLRKQF